MQPQEITYQWQVNFAVILSLLAILITLIRWFVEYYQKKKKERVQAYEEVYEDSCYILFYPYEKRRLKTKRIQYINSDPKLQKAVRDRIDSHWMKSMGGLSMFELGKIKDIDAYFAFMNLVGEEASKFQDTLRHRQYDVDLYEKSPVFHLTNPDVVSRFNRVMSYVGRHLSLFSDKIKSSWEDAKYKDYQDVRKDYKKALGICKHYFKHNQRDFPDPFYELLDSIRQEYRELTQKRGSFVFIKIKWKLEHFIRNMIHPIQSYKERKELKEIISDSNTAA
jgi:hypothetical protein